MRTSGRNSSSARQKIPARKTPAVPYGEEYSTKVDLAADPVIPYMSSEALQKLITKRREEMVDAAKKMEFIEAARLRDEILAMEERLAKMISEA